MARTPTRKAKKKRQTNKADAHDNDVTQERKHDSEASRLPSSGVCGQLSDQAAVVDTSESVTGQDVATLTTSEPWGGDLQSLLDDASFEARGGHVASYIPELVLAPEDKTGVAIVYTDGRVFSAGDCGRYERDPTTGGIEKERRGEDDSFSIQSISKVFALLYVLETVGENEVFKRMRKEPTGDPFNASPKIREIGGVRMPDNPLINVGAILTTSMFPEPKRTPGDGPQTTSFDLFLQFVRKLTASECPLIVDEDVYKSELGTGHNNRALAWQMSADGVFQNRGLSTGLRAGVDALTEEQLKEKRDAKVAEVDKVERILRNYFRQCSILVTARQLANAAALLANDGIRPNGYDDTGKPILSSSNVRTVIGLMSSCGMYDGSGQFAHDVGIPSKSGVGGGIMAVAPGIAGVATYAPPLDPMGNSVRGLYIMKKLAERNDWSLFSRPYSGWQPSVFCDDQKLRALTDKVRNHRVPPSEDFKKQDYIPQLGAQDALDTGIAICSLSRGEEPHLYAGGESGQTFTMQSISTLFGFIYALNRQSEGIVFQYVGKEPSGEAFSYLKWKTWENDHARRQIPFNAMINAGAILIAAMIPRDYKKKIGTGSKKSSDPSDGLLDIDSFLKFVKKMCDNPHIDINWDVYQSERDTGYNNRSLAWQMNDKGVFDQLMRRHGLAVDAAVIEDILSVYFRLCSIEVTCVDLAKAAAVLANQGKALDGSSHLVPPRHAAIAVSLMSSSGMFDGSGEFASSVGIPAKSGVSGGILACVPGKCGIGAFSPVVDPKGNSFRGTEMLKELADQENLSIFTGRGE